MLTHEQYTQAAEDLAEAHDLLHEYGIEVCAQASSDANHAWLESLDELAHRLLTLSAALPEPEPYIGVSVTVSASEQDGAPIVQIDTDAALEGANGEPQIRVYVNDWRAFAGKPYAPADLLADALAERWHR